MRPSSLEQTLNETQFLFDLSYRIKALIYGPPGAGKTVLAAGAPNPVLLDSDGTGALSLMNHPELALNTMVLQVRSFNQVLDIFEAAATGHPKFADRETYIIDTLSELQKKHLDEHVAKERQINPNRAALPFQQDYKTNTAAMRQLVIYFKELDCNFICTAHEQTDKDDGTGIITTHPFLTPRLASTMEGMFDIFGFMQAETDSEFNVTRTLQIMPSRRIRAKTRIGGLPPIMKNPSFSDILDAKARMVDGMQAFKDARDAELAAAEVAKQAEIGPAEEQPSEEGVVT